MTGEPGGAVPDWPAASPGVSVVVLSYDRPRALAALLDDLAAQDLGGLPLELIVCNNHADSRVARSRWTRSGRLLQRLDAKVLNSSHNWRCRARYALTALARSDVVLFVDDDIRLLERGFVADMHRAFSKLRSIDILSCWTALWTGWDERELCKVRMNFEGPEPAEVTECDYVGPGICMFDRRLVLRTGLLDLAPEHHASDSAWFPWLTAMRVGSRKFYLPSHGRLAMHAQFERHALTATPGFRPSQYSAYKAAWRSGYVPVVARLRGEPGFEGSAVARAARTLPVERDAW